MKRKVRYDMIPMRERCIETDRAFNERREVRDQGKQQEQRGDQTGQSGPSIKRGSKRKSQQRSRPKVFGMDRQKQRKGNKIIPEAQMDDAKPKEGSHSPRSWTMQDAGR